MHSYGYNFALNMLPHVILLILEELFLLSPEVYMQESEQQRIMGRYGFDEIKANQLEAWPNQYTDRDFVTHFEIPEFTCLCPRSGFPDFATIIVDYVPDQSVVELKSLKLYINSFRDRQISHEVSTNVILDDLVKLLSPRWMRVVGDFTVRGNIKTVVTTEYARPDYQGPRPELRRYLPTNG
jgi:7-cyano-7-deazaguanine reductase